MIEFAHIDKSFAGTRALSDVSFRLQPGRTLGLVGENGAGKSTLMNICGGNLQPDAGRMLLEGKPYTPRSPLDAMRHGVAFIHQELNLFPNLSIAENLFLTTFPSRAVWLIDRSKTRSRCAELLAAVGLALDPDLPVERLSAGEQQLVEVAKAVGLQARLIIFDEPTTSLTAPEAERLYALIARLRREGLSLLYISHALGDVLRLCDDIVVLRDGKLVGSGPQSEFTLDRLVSLMVGRSVSGLYPQRTGTPGREVLLEAKALSQRGIIRDISFELHRGEVLGIAGLLGAGRSELARILFGLDSCERGELLLGTQSVLECTPRQRIRQGFVFLTENRREEGLCLEAGISDNMVLASLDRFSRGPLGWLDLTAISSAIRRLRDAVRLSPTARDSTPAKNLSGGNQQKLVLAKWLLAEPRVLLLDEPTRGVDVGARLELYHLIQQLAENGAGVLVISSELEELLGLCDRLLVMSHGEIRDELSRAEFDRERIMRAAFAKAQSSSQPAAETQPLGSS